MGPYAPPPSVASTRSHRGAGRSHAGSTRPPTRSTGALPKIPRIVAIHASPTSTSSSVSARRSPRAAAIPVFSAAVLPGVASRSWRSGTGNVAAALARTRGVSSVLPLSTTTTSSPGAYCWRRSCSSAPRSSDARLYVAMTTLMRFTSAPRNRGGARPHGCRVAAPPRPHVAGKPRDPHLARGGALRPPGHDGADRRHDVAEEPPPEIAGHVEEISPRRRVALLESRLDDAVVVEPALEVREAQPL